MRHLRHQDPPGDQGHDQELHGQHAQHRDGQPGLFRFAHLNDHGGVTAGNSAVSRIGWHGDLALQLSRIGLEFRLTETGSSQMETLSQAGPPVTAGRPLKEATFLLARVDHQSDIQRLVEEVLADERVHAGQEHTPAGMCVVPAHHLSIGGKLVPLARDIAPRLVREFETSPSALVVCGPQAVGNHHERLALFVLALASQQHAAQLHVRIGQRMGLHVAQDVHVHVNRQVVRTRRLAGHDGIVAVLVGTHPPAAGDLFQFAESNVVVHIGVHEPRSNEGITEHRSPASKKMPSCDSGLDAHHVVGRDSQITQSGIGQLGIRFHHMRDVSGERSAGTRGR